MHEANTDNTPTATEALPVTKTARRATPNFWGAPIFQYTREQALSDGVLVDVTTEARHMGFKLPVAISAAAWEQMVSWSDKDSEHQVIQDEAGRLSDVLWMAYLSALRAKQLSQLNYELYSVPKDGKSRRPRLQTLSLHIGPGDDGGAVLTILLPGKD